MGACMFLDPPLLQVSVGVSLETAQPAKGSAVWRCLKPVGGSRFMGRAPIHRSVLQTFT